MKKPPRKTAGPGKPVFVVVRAWPGVHNGQRLNDVHPDRAKRLLKGGFIRLAEAA